MATAPQPQTKPPEFSGAWKGLAGFFVLGMLNSFLGAMLPAWRHHLTADWMVVGYHFLSMNLGIAAGLGLSRLLPGRWLRCRMAAACGLAGGVLVALALVPPGFSPWWRVAAVSVLGLAAGLLSTAVFQVISPLYRRDKGSTLSQAGALLGAGSIVMTLLVAGTFHSYSVTTILLLMAVFPAGFLILYIRASFAPDPEPGAEPTLRQALASLKNPSAVLFMLLLFFQFGNEWSLAGWLPLYLVQRLGTSPASALGMLALYWFALVAGRFVVFSVLPAVNRKKMLGASVIAALFGCLLLMATDNHFGAVMALLLIGGGFASIYPLVAELIRGRFRYYHPGAFNGIFSFALTGGLLAPWSLGPLVEHFGLSMVAVLPLLGSIMVFLLLVLLWAEARLRETLSREQRKLAEG